MAMNKTKGCNSELLTLYHYRELNADETRAIEDHLAQCPACRAELQNIEGALAKVPQMSLEINALEKQRFRSRVFEKQNRRHWKRPVWGSALAAAGVLALVLLIIPGTGTQPDVGAPVLADLEVLEQMDLLLDFDLLQDLEMFEAMGGLR
jgi:predicted anti-sigma-YlaC factor YlaD